MPSQIQINFKSDNKKVIEFGLKGEIDELFPKFEQAKKIWDSKEKDLGSIILSCEKNYVIVKFSPNEDSNQAEEKFFRFFENYFNEEDDILYEPLKLAISLGILKLSKRSSESISILMENPNRVLEKLNASLQKIWPGVSLQYHLKFFPISFSIRPSPDLSGEEYSCNVEDQTQVTFFYNPAILNFNRGLEMGVNFIFSWLNHQRLTLQTTGSSLEKGRNWPYDQEFHEIQAYVLDLARKTFFSLDENQIDSDPILICYRILCEKPHWAKYFRDEIFRQILDKYPESSPLLGRIAKNEREFEKDQT